MQKKYITYLNKLRDKTFLKFGNPFIKIENVNSISIKDLIEKYNFNEFELLYIDTEGYDGNIIIDFLETCFIKPFLIFEYIHIEHDTFKKTLKILKEKDYSYFKVDENLLCFSHKKSFF